MKCLLRSTVALHAMLNEMYKKNIELKRLARAGYVLLKTGCLFSTRLDALAEKIIESQCTDGSWCGSYICTAWCLAFLRECGQEGGSIFLRGMEFLLSSENIWGHHPGDNPRIPSTGLIMYLLPSIRNIRPSIAKKLLILWSEEFASLTYKAAYTLMGLGRAVEENEMIEKTVFWLCKNQESDGSFKPWGGHPIHEGNVVWTALSVISLLPYIKSRGVRKTIDQADRWLRNSQLPNGIWPHHEIDEGVSWALLSLCEHRRYDERQI